MWSPPTSSDDDFGSGTASTSSNGDATSGSSKRAIRRQQDGSASDGDSSFQMPVYYTNYSVPVDYSDSGLSDRWTADVTFLLSVAFNSTPGPGTGGPSSFLEVAGDGENFTVVTAFLNGFPQADPALRRPPYNQLLEGSAHLNCTDPNNTNSWPCKGQGAMNCSLSACVQRLQTTVTNGDTDEEILESVIFPGDQGSTNEMPGAIVDRTCVVQTQPDFPNLVQLDHGTPLDDRKDWLLLSRSTTDTMPDGNVSTPEHDNSQPANVTMDGQFYFMVPFTCVYGIEAVTQSTIYYYLQSLLQGNAKPFDNDPDGAWMASSAYNATPAVLQLFQGGNLTADSVNATFQGIAKGLTRQIRQAGLSNYNLPANGTVYIPETCIGVRWRWMAYPALLTVMVLVFVVTVIVETGWDDQDHHDWKTSALPVLFNGLEHRPSDSRDAVVTSSAMKSQASQIRVQLGRTAEGWRLKNA